MNVRVTLVRGLRRLVLLGVSSLSLPPRRAVVLSVDVSLPEVVDVDEVGGPLMSVVSGGLVLVIVWVVVGVVADCVAVAEKVGSMKLRGASSGSPNWRDSAVATTIRTPITARARTLAPMSAGVRLCQGCGDESRRLSS